MKPDSTAWITRWQLGLALLALALAAGWITRAVFFETDVPFLTNGGGDWITPYHPVDSDGIRVDLTNVPAYTFVKAFELEEVPSRAEFEIRAVGEGELRVNETRLWQTGRDANWKRTQTGEVTNALRAGANEIRVRVANPRGPALLQLRIVATEPGDEGETIVSSDASWRALDPEARWVETMRASDTRPAPQSFELPSTGSALVARAGVLGLLFALGVAASFALGRSLPERLRRRAPEATVAAAILFWTAVYVTKTSRLPLLMGFDIPGHLAYIQFLLERGALPLATDGWSMYHPPLAHALIAGLGSLTGVAPADEAARWVYRLPGFVAGLVNVFAVWLTARRLFAGDPLRTSLAVGFAALLPMSLTMSAYVSNEPVHAALVSAALCVACALLVAPTGSLRRMASLSVLLGLAILTKFTALLAVPVIGFFLAVKLWLVDRWRPTRALGTTAAVLAGVAAIGGWFYWRSWRLFGSPVVGNWNLPGQIAWWEQPGFHTSTYYTSFGQALSYPFFAGYASFWDGVYSTFWGDGLVAGMVQVATRHDAWRYDYMTAGYWLAFPASLLLLAGALRAVRFCLTESDLGLRLAGCLLVVFAGVASFALLAITFQLPFYAQAKAFYVLCAIVPLSIFAGLGFAWPLERLPSRVAPLRWAYCGWLATLAGCIALSFLG